MKRKADSAGQRAITLFFKSVTQAAAPEEPVYQMPARAVEPAAVEPHSAAPADLPASAPPAPEASASAEPPPPQPEPSAPAATGPESPQEPAPQQEAEAEEGPAAAAGGGEASLRCSDALGGEECKAGENAYERERLERIRRNQGVMRSLGLGAPAISPRRKAPRPAPAKRAPRPPPAPAEAARRSMRSRGPAPGSAGGWEQQPAAAAAAPEEPPLTFDDSSVLRYVCDAPCGMDGGEVGGRGGAHAPGTAITGFCQLPRHLSDPALARAYSVDWRPGLVVAGGKDGQVSVFGSRQAERRGGQALAEAEDAGAPPLISHRLHKGWISDVQFLSGDSAHSVDGSSGSGGAGLRLLTAGNDGDVSLWDLGRSASGVPLRLVRAAGLHSGGIFSMHEAGGRVLTASKDGTVAVSALDGGASLALVTRFDELHGGVVKCARWRAAGGGAQTFASCGNDRRVCIVDARVGGSSTSAALSLEGHGTSVNALRWHPSSEHLLLSASHDPRILLHDLRAPAAPLYAFAGHSQERRLSAIYQPTFVAGGDAIATGGEKSYALSLYCTKTGATISRGDVGIAFGATACGGSPTDPLVVTTTRACYLFEPRWKQTAAAAQE